MNNVDGRRRATAQCQVEVDPLFQDHSVTETGFNVAKRDFRRLAVCCRHLLLFGRRNCNSLAKDATVE